jgi:transcriptional regulator with XRE-family HTH domain
MNADQLERILERIGISQRSAARRLGINERTMRKYIAGDAAIPRTVSLALERLRIDREHEALLAELRGAREAVGAPFAQTTRKFRAIAEGKSRENPTLAEIRTASDAMDRFEKARKRLQQFFDENRATYVG